MDSGHTLRAFDAELMELTRMLAQMGGMVEAQVADAVNALAKRDKALGRRVAAADPAVETLRNQLDEQAIVTIARRQPVAVDLREVVSVLRVSADLKRIAELAKNIGRRAGALEGDFRSPQLIRGLTHLAALVLGQLKTVLDSYAGHDTAGALGVWRGDKEVDELYTALVRELLTYMIEDQQTISFCLQIMFCAKNLERIGDHTTNIAESVYYVVEGRTITDVRPKGDSVNLTGVGQERSA